MLRRARPAAARRACSCTTGGRRRRRRRSATTRSAPRCAPARAWSWPRAPTPRRRAVQGGPPRARRRQPARRWRATPASAGRTPCRTTTWTPTGYRAYQDAHAQAVRPGGRAACSPRPTIRAAIPTWSSSGPGRTRSASARSWRGRSPGAWSTSRRRPTTGFSFYAPNVWMHQKRVLFPTLRDPRQPSLQRPPGRGGRAAARRRRARRRTRPPCTTWDELAEAHQAIHENRHAGHPDGPRGRHRRARRRAHARARSTRRGARASSTARPCACGSIRCGRARRSSSRWSRSTSPPANALGAADARRPRARAGRARGASRDAAARRC